MEVSGARKQRRLEGVVCKEELGHFTKRLLLCRRSSDVAAFVLVASPYGFWLAASALCEASHQRAMQESVWVTCIMGS